MATSFPGAQDSFPTYNDGDTIYASIVNDVQDAVEALETKVGIDGSADPTSLDYRVTALENAGGSVSYPMSAFHVRPDTISTADPRNTGQSLSLPNQQVLLAYFAAPFDLAVSNIRWVSSNSVTSLNAGSGFALYQADGSDNLTRLATALSTSAFTSASTVKSEPLSSTVNLVAGQRYAVGALALPTSGTPSILAAAAASTASAKLQAFPPRLTGVLLGQSSLPASISAGSLHSDGSTYYLYAELY